MTRKLFAALNVYHDIDSRSAAMNMAIDEALLETATVATIRFYRWDHPALSFGYFGKFADVESFAAQRDLVRRWTGGGIVLHGEDLTYSLVVPATDPAFSQSSMAIYEKVHGAMQVALLPSGQHAELLRQKTLNAQRSTPNIQSEAVTSACFANPVRADVMLNGRKIAGAAQRRTRNGLLQQGSIQSVELRADFVNGFIRALSATVIDTPVDEPLLTRAGEIAQQKYGTENWLRRR
jgi:lipoate-protein ligase A